MAKIVVSNRDILSGTPVFSGTRVPVRVLFEHLEAGDGIDEFLKDFPSVTRNQVHELLRKASRRLVDEAIEAAT